MLIIDEQALQLEPLTRVRNWYMASAPDGVRTAVWMPALAISDEEQDALASYVARYRDAVTEYGAYIPELLSWGCSKNGVPYVQTEWIEGPGIDEVSTETNNIRSEKELLRATEHLFRVLMICHKLDIGHGNIHMPAICRDSHSNHYTLRYFNFLPDNSGRIDEKDLHDLGSLLMTISPQTHPQWLQDALTRCVSNEPLQRYRHAGDFYLTVLRNNKPAENSHHLSKLPSTPSATPAVAKAARKNNPHKKRNGRIALPIAVGTALTLLGALVVLYTRDQQTRDSKPAVAMTAPVPKPITETASPLPEVPDRVVVSNAPLKKTQAPKTTAAVARKESKLPKATAEPAVEKAAVVYLVKDIAHFHNQPDPTTQRKAFINKWNNARLRPLDERNDFIYIVYRNDEGQVSKGWLSKKDLIASR